MNATKSVTAVETLQHIREDVERIKTDEQQTFPEAASSGDTFRQGDIYITRLPDSCCKEMIEDPDAPLQLAPGNTHGSRHILDSRYGVVVYKRESPNALEGPVLKTTETRTITHPEHGDVILPPGVYGIRYQRAYADEFRRVAD